MSWEINSIVADPDAVITVTNSVSDGTKIHDDFPRNNRTSVQLRKSNTEPVLRLHVETRGDRPLLSKKRELLH